MARLRTRAVATTAGFAALFLAGALAPVASSAPAESPPGVTATSQVPTVQNSTEEASTAETIEGSELELDRSRTLDVQKQQSAQPSDEDERGGQTMDVQKGQQLRKGGSSYPRLVRLQHSGEANGRFLSSMTTYWNETGLAVIYESLDGGKTFREISVIHDRVAENKKGMCCSTLYELPQQVGNLPAGTLLWAGTAGIGDKADKRQSSIRLWASHDHGKTWSFLSTVAAPPVGPGVWEPEFTVTPQGELVAFYADDMHPKHDQKIVQVKSRDGVHWTDLRDTVANNTFRVRPGMPGVRRLPNGSYVMVYEVCNYVPNRVCGVFMRTSGDGWNWGDPRNMGTEIRSSGGNFPMHTPTIAWMPNGGPNGRLILGYQFLVDGSSRLAPGHGKTLMVNDNPTDLASGWKEIPAPVQLHYTKGSSCRGFSPTVASTVDEQSIVQITTDYIEPNGPCEAFYGQGAVGASPAAAATRLDAR